MISTTAFQRLFVFLGLFLIAILLAAGCGKNAGHEELIGVPLSRELRPAIEASRRSLREPDRGEDAAKLAVDQFYGFSQMFANPELRKAAADSLFALWEADPENFLWPDLAFANWYLFDRGVELNGMFFHPDLMDTSTAVGAYMSGWRNIKSDATSWGFHRARELNEELDPLQRIWLIFKLGIIETRSGNADTAAQSVLKILPEARQLGGRRLEFVAWYWIAIALMGDDHLNDALHAITMAENLVNVLPRQSEYQFAGQLMRLWHAKILDARRETEAAFTFYQSCADSSLALGLPRLAARSLNRAATLTSSSGNYERALILHNQTLAITLADQDSLRIPRCMMNVARHHRLLGQLDSCLAYMKEAERWVQAYPSFSNVSRMPLMQAEYYAQIGDYAMVDSLHEAAAGMVPNKNTMETLSELHLLMIKESIEQGRPDLAYRSIALLGSLRGKLRNSAADTNVLFDLDLYSADFLSRQGQYTRAASALDRAAEALQGRPDPTREWRLHEMRGRLARSRGDLAGAETAFRNCVAMSEQRQDRDHLALSRFRLGSVLMARGQFDETRRLFPADDDAAFGGRFRTQLSVLLLKGVSYSREGRFDDALHELLRARELCTPWSPSDLVARIALEMGKALTGAGRHEEARNEYALVKANLAERRDEPGEDILVFIESDLRRDLVEAMLKLELTGTDDGVRGPIALAALHAARAVLPGWGLHDAENDESYLSPQLIFFVGREAGFHWFIGKDVVQLKRGPGEDALREKLAPVLADLSTPGRDISARELEALLEVIGGAPLLWPEDETLCIVPDGFLYAIPWSALPWAKEKGQTWLDHGALSLVDSPVLRGKIPGGKRRLEGRLLALGVDGSAQVNAAKMRSLHHAEREAREVYERWPADRATLKVGDDVDWSGIESSEWASYDVIHIASHALVYQGAMDQTTLLLAGSTKTLTSGEIRDLDLDAELVFLSCCEAAESFGRGMGPAHAGLARAFLAAGADVVVAPTLRIDDETARRIAGRFYEHYSKGLSVEAALRLAQLDLREAGEHRGHPAYWAFYHVIRGKHD